jgi:RNA polymerase sigma factor (sigma-70 family)
MYDLDRQPPAKAASGRRVGGALRGRASRGSAAARPRSDAVLVARLRSGETGAFDEIFVRYQAPLLSYCRHMLGNLADGEDAVQQTFIRAHRGLLSDSPPRDLRPWLYAIAGNCSRSGITARRPVSDLDEHEPSLAGLSDEVRRREDLHELVGDLQALPDDQRSALLLAELEDLPHEQIAAIVGCSAKKVKALIHQARTTLIAQRDARAAPCEEIRMELSVARGGELRRGPLRRHLNLCDGCRDYAIAVADQRRSLAVILPVLPGVGFAARVLGHTAAGTGGLVAAASGHAGGAALAGTSGSAATAGGAGASGAASGAAGIAGTTTATAGAGATGTSAAVTSAAGVAGTGAAAAGAGAATTGATGAAALTGATTAATGAAAGAGTGVAGVAAATGIAGASGSAVTAGAATAAAAATGAGAGGSAGAIVGGGIAAKLAIGGAVAVIASAGAAVTIHHATHHPRAAAQALRSHVRRPAGRRVTTVATRRTTATVAVARERRAAAGPTGTRASARAARKLSAAHPSRSPARVATRTAHGHVTIATATGKTNPRSGRAPAAPGRSRALSTTPAPGHAGRVSPTTGTPLTKVKGHVQPKVKGHVRTKAKADTRTKVKVGGATKVKLATHPRKRLKPAAGRPARRKRGP